MSKQKKNLKEHSCPNCKLPTDGNELFPSDHFIEWKNEIKEQGLILKPETEIKLKDELQGCCEACGIQTSIKVVISECLVDSNNRHAIIEQIETLEYLATETVLQTCKMRVLSEIENSRDPKLWKIFMLLVNIPEQPRHVTEHEKAFMKELRRRFHFSISELSLIFNRSSETIFRQLESGGEMRF